MFDNSKHLLTLSQIGGSLREWSTNILRFYLQIYKIYLQNLNTKIQIQNYTKYKIYLQINTGVKLSSLLYQAVVMFNCTGPKVNQNSGVNTTLNPEPGNASTREGPIRLASLYFIV